ncbi:oxidoreductase [Bradyrhizobium elkanii]|uniref:oxidoreductase n=1 Tax=Bradyrhizobium elkanii TaxID=29448 RepID=UPI002225E212|nr:oxidoreductase [Bradyrhizobium elkanii]MCW2228075.1 hypothetical protein [Bradyrhizobium elkanii]
MAGKPLDQELAEEAAAAYRADGFKVFQQTADALGLVLETYKSRLKVAAARGLLLDKPAPAMPGFRVSQVTDGPNGQTVQQRPEPAEPKPLPEGHLLKGVSRLQNGDGEILLEWVKTDRDREQQAAQMRAVVDAFKEELPRAEPVLPIPSANADLLNQYTITDLHMGMLAWGEETGADWDLKIAEKLLLDWFTAAIRMSPSASVAVLAQLGDLLHHETKVPITQGHGHVLDADSRLQKMIRVAIRTMRRVVHMLLEKHERVHVIMADANHDESGGAWLREMFAQFFDEEPRVTVDTNPGSYYVVEHGATSLFYHHGHKRKIKQVDTVFAGKYREIYGRTKFAYGHIGHLHSDELISTNLMKVERHETLAAPDAYAANGGWLSGRSAKVITYSRQFGEVGRITLTPEMVRQ